MKSYTEVQSVLANLCVDSSHTKDHQLYFDTFRHQYIRFHESFTWPELPVESDDLTKAADLLPLIAPRLESILCGYSLLPEIRSRRDNGYLHFGRLIECAECEMNLISHIRIASHYLGGDGERRTLGEWRQGFTPSFITDRIYLHCRLLPIESEEFCDGSLYDFKPHRIGDAVQKVIYKGEGKREKWSTILFDEVDYTRVHQHFADLLVEAGVKLRPVKISPMLQIEFMTMVLQPYLPYWRGVESMAPHFAALFRSYLSTGDFSKTPEASRHFWQEWSRRIDYEVVDSESGNRHWRLIELPLTETGA